MTSADPEPDPDERLALAYGVSSLRPAFSALLALDQMLSRSVLHVSQPLLGRIRIAWWREQCELLSGEAPMRDPLLIGLRALDRSGVLPASRLAPLFDAWDALAFGDDESDGGIAAHGHAAGSTLYMLAAELAGIEPTDAVAGAGAVRTLMKIGRSARDDGPARMARAAAASLPRRSSELPPRLRPFAILARFAERDALAPAGRLPAQGSPRRLLQIWGLIAGIR